MDIEVSIYADIVDSVINIYSGFRVYDLEQIL